MHAIQGAVHWPSWGKLQMNPSECLAGVMLAMQKRLLKNSMSDDNYVGTFRVPFWPDLSSRNHTALEKTNLPRRHGDTEKIKKNVPDDR